MNYLEDSLNVLVKQLAYLDGTRHHITAYFKKYIDDYLSSWDFSKVAKPKFLLFTNFVIEDISDGRRTGARKIYPTGEGYSVDIETRKNDEDLLNLFYGFIISQGYEAFETFLKKILNAYFTNNPSETERILAVDNTQLKKALEKGGKNNRKYFQYISSLSIDFLSVQKSNNIELDLDEWFELFSEVRHSFTHRNGRVIKSDYDCITLLNRKKFSTFFPVINKGKTEYYLIGNKQCEWILHLEGEFAFQVFKTLSIIKDLDWKVLKNMN